MALLEPSDGLALQPVLQNPKEHVLLAVDVVAEPRLGHADYPLAISPMNVPS